MAGRRKALGGVLVAIVLACVAIPALGAQTKDVTIDPAAAAGAPGLTDLEGLTYAQAETRLRQLSEITLPLAIDGLDLIEADGVTLDSSSSGRSLSLSGTAQLPAVGDVDLLVTAVWASDDATDPAVAIAAKADDLSLSDVNPLWDDSYGDLSFATARLAVANRDHELDPALLPAAAQDFYAEPVALTGGVSFAGDLTLDGRMAEAFGYAGYSGEVALEGSLAASAALLFGDASDAELGALSLTATLTKSPTAPAWIADRTSTFAFSLDDGSPALSVAEDVTVSVDGTTNRFQGAVDIAPAGAIAAEVALVGELDPPFGLDGLDALSDVKLRLARDGEITEGGLSLGVTVEGRDDPLTVLAGFVTGGGTTRADFAIEGSLTVPQLVGFAGDLLGTPTAAVPGADDVSLDGVSFSFTTTGADRTFSVGAGATVKGLEADAVLTLRTSAGAAAQPLLGLRLAATRMSELLPADQAGEILSGLELPALNLTVATVEELAAEDLTPQEETFFGGIYDTLPDTLAFTPGVNLQARLPVDLLGEDVRTALGYPTGAEVVLAGTLGVSLGALDGGGATLDSLALEATLPAATESTVLPTWIEQTTPTTLSFRYEQGAVGASFDTGADVTIDGSTFATTISGAFERAAGRSSIAFRGTITDWQEPFGVSWIDSIDEATLALDTSFGGGGPSTVDASVTAATELGGKTFELEFALSRATTTTASLTARFADTATLGEIAGLFPELDTAEGDLSASLDGLSVGPVAVALQVGGAASAFELTARTTFTTDAGTALTSDLLVAARSGGAFTLGIKPRGSVALDDLVADAPAVNIALPTAALVLGSEAGTRPVAQLTDGEFDFYKDLYGCAPDAARDECTDFARLDLTRGLKLLAAFELGDDVETMAEEIGIQTGGSALVSGTIPVFGGTDFSLRAALGNFRFDEQPDWYERGDVALEIGANGLKFAGELGVKIQREGAEWMPDCEGGVIRGTFVDGAEAERCYDLLTFEIGARVSLQPAPSFTLTGALKTDSPWRNAFGQDWLEIRRVAIQLGVTLPVSGPEVTMGFQGDIKIGEKDIAAALKVGLAPIPGPPFVRPNLIGFSAASRAGLALSDIVWLNNQITGEALEVDTETMPDVSLRNLFFQYSQQTDVDLCLTQGVRFNADLYVGTNLPGPEGDDDASGCRSIDTDPETRQSCQERSEDGCLASVYGRFDSGGLQARGELSAFELGPVSFEDSLVEVALTPSNQRIRLKGGARVGTDGYELAKGHADLDFSRDGFSFKGDAAMFEDAFHGYVELDAPFDMKTPSFKAKAWLRADARSAMNGLVGEKAEKVRPIIVGFGQLLAAIGGDGSVTNVRDLPALLEKAGATVPPEVRAMTTALGDAQAEIQRYAGPVLTLQPLLKGFSINVPGIPGINVPRTCITVEKSGRCWTTPPWGPIPGIPGTWVPGYCVNVIQSGTCYFTPPFGVTVPGICQALGIPSASADCSWAGLVRRYVLPALLEAIEETTGMEFDAATFEDAITKLVDRFADGVGSIVNVDCAYFSADASGLARGEVDVDIATRLRLFDHPLEFGASWDFRTKGGSPDEIVAAIFRTIFSPSATTCPALPAGREAPGEEVPSRKLTAVLSPSTTDEGGSVTLSGTFDAEAGSYPAVRVDWGDGTSSTVPAGSSRTISASHAYPNDGAPGLPEAGYAVSAVVQDAGAHTVPLSATVRNVAPTVGSLSVEPSPSDEHGVVTLRGRVTDPGALDRHEVRVDWGDGSEPSTAPLANRELALTHRYLDDAEHTVTAVVTDDDTGSATRSVTADVRNVAPSGIAVTPLEVVAAEGEAPGAGPVAVTEGAIVTYGIDFEDPGTLDTHSVTVDWGDGDAPQTLELGAGSRHVELPHRFLDDGTFDVAVTVTDDDGGEGAATAPVDVANVAPQVTAELDAAAIDEGGSVRIDGSISDPGVLDSHTVTIDWGAGRTAADRYETVPVAAGDRTFGADKPYGDDGAFTIGVTVQDDDGGTGEGALPLAVANRGPAAAIDRGRAVQTPGGETFLARAGTPLELRARATDAGSDDLGAAWTWRDGTTTVTAFLAAPPAADPDPSPQVGPRDLVDAQAHTWSAPCLYADVAVAVDDDDGGRAGDAVDVVVTGTADRGEGAGGWQREYDPGKAPRLPADRLACYLEIVDQMSDVFGPLSRAGAYDALNPGPGANSEEAKLERELLTAWLNFAHGALDHAAIAPALAAAETTRLDPGAPKKDFQDARQAVQRVGG